MKQEYMKGEITEELTHLEVAKDYKRCEMY